MTADVGEQFAHQVGVTLADPARQPISCAQFADEVRCIQFEQATNVHNYDMVVVKLRPRDRPELVGAVVGIGDARIFDQLDTHIAASRCP